MRIYLMICIGFFLFGAVKAQRVEGSVLLRFKENGKIEDFLQQEYLNKIKLFGFRPVQILSDQLHIWEFAFDESQIPFDEIAYVMSSDTHVVAFQENRKLNARNTIPNDPLFPDQWQFANNGSNGGIVDADIDLDDAWDISTGGVTPSGDTIVICVIDDGIDLNHADLAPNLWVNRNEIPFNFVDDDANGYIDDYLGWNSYLGNDQITGGINAGFHGSSVAGLIGARGNNSVGVSGVNWHVKMMVVVGGGTEAQAIAAYNYPLKMRKKYNQTQGAAGAFVVATSSSWGTNSAFASSAPLWCAIYDSLGLAGVINVAATANANIDVELQGDLPTHCPSPYLITVTNSDRRDQKVNQAAFGSVSIDLSAPGEQAFTTAKPNSYVAFNGTSAACPLVAGSVGLIYSSPCISFSDLYRLYPDSAALKVKSFLLESVDTLPSLQGITVSGGRLNVYKTMLRTVDSTCRLVACPAPSFPFSEQLSNNEVILRWGSPSGFLPLIRLRWRQMQGNWIDTIVQDSFYHLRNLQTCETYQWQIGRICDTTNSLFSPVFTFTTGGCCLLPNQINNTRLMSDIAEFQWQYDSLSLGYEIVYSAEGSNLWTSIFSPNANVLFTNLDSCERYEFFIRSFCAADSSATDTLTFLSRGCGSCRDLNYCSSYGNDASYEWISEVNLANFNNSSNSNQGYANFTPLAPIVNRAVKYPFSFRLSTVPNPAPNWRWKAWIDYNQDGIFQDSSECFYNSMSAGSNFNPSDSLTIPSDAVLGNTRLRVSMRWGNSGLHESCSTFGFGEVEDYCILIEDAASAVSYNARPELQLFPNPTQRICNYTIPFLPEENTRCALYQSLGSKVWETVLNQKEGVLDFQDLPWGIYILKIDGFAPQKIILLQASN